MDISKILKDHGVEDVESVLKAMTENGIYLSSEENIDIRYNKLKGQHEELKEKVAETDALIEELRSAQNPNEELQAKISEYEKNIAELKARHEQAETDAALKVALLEAKVADVDYITYKIKQEGEVKLGEDGKIVGIEETINSLKTKYPSQFEAPKPGEKRIEENKLPENEGPSGPTKEDFSKMTYMERVELKQNDPDTYNKLAKGE